MYNIVYPKNRLPSTIPAEAEIEIVIDHQLVTDPIVPTDHTRTLKSRINASPNKAELLIQFCERGETEGVSLLFAKSPEVSCTFDNLRAWRLCISGNVTQQNIARILLKNSPGLCEIHADALRGAIVDSNQARVNQLLPFVDIIGLQYSDYFKLAKTAAVTCDAETADELLRLAIKDREASSPDASVLGDETAPQCMTLNVLLRAIESGNTEVLEKVLVRYVTATADCGTRAKCETAMGLLCNAELLLTACQHNHMPSIQLVLDNLPFDASERYFLPEILKYAIKGESVLTAAVFDVFGEKLTAESITTSHLKAACSRGLVQVVKILCAKGSFKSKYIIKRFRSSVGKGQTEVAVCLIESFPRVLTSAATELRPTITDPNLLQAISQYA